MMKDTILELVEIKKEYRPGEIVLNDVNFTVSEGTIVAITGENGTGKSTLLRIIAGLDSDYRGSVKYRNEKYTKPSTRIILLHQTYEQLFPWLTVEQNLCQPIMLSSKITYNDAMGKSHLSLQNVGIDKALFKRYPFQLSGGQKQKVALARALALDADILLMDEPFSAIDEKTRVFFQTMIKKLAKEKKTILIVSHSADEVNKVADKVICLENNKTS